DEQFVHIELEQGRLEISAPIGEGLEGRIRILLRIHSLREDQGSRGQLEVRMESGAFRPLDAVGGPGPAKLLEVLRLPRVPVPREENGAMAAFEERARQAPDAGRRMTRARRTARSSRARPGCHRKKSAGECA